MIVSDLVTISPSTGTGSEIAADAFGINLVLGYERFGTLPWEKFDEVQSAVGSNVVRFPGGSESETLFSYAGYNATTVTTKDDSVKQLIAVDDFLDYCARTSSRATINLPVLQLLTEGSYGKRDFNLALIDEVRSYISHVLEKTGPLGIATFELGNEYESYMTSLEYGRVASELALITSQEIDKYYQGHLENSAYRPEIAVQLWGQSQGGAYSIADLSARNHTVMVEFNSSEMAAVTAVTSHFYYKEGANLGEPNYHVYSNIRDSVEYSISMMNDWNAAAGRPLDTIFSEWNLNMSDSKNYGLQQVPILLELFSSFMESGVDQLDFWSTMYHPTSLANYQGGLQAAGTLFQIMTHDLTGMKACVAPVASDRFDIHAYTGDGKAVVFVSSLIDDAMNLDLDLSRYLDRFDLMSARLMSVDLSHSDGKFKGIEDLAPWEEGDAPILVVGQEIANFLVLGHYSSTLAPHQTLILLFDRAPTMWGTALPDMLTGNSADDRIEGLDASDLIRGLPGNDSLYGGSGDDTLNGGSGADRVSGSDGNDFLAGRFGNDTIEGQQGNDVLYGGASDDYLVGGNNSDTLTGGSAADAFVFHSGEWGTDLITDFSSFDSDFLVFDGASSTEADFFLEFSVVPNVGSSAPDLIVHFGVGGPALWILQDGGGLSSVMLLDANSGDLYSLH